MQCMCMPGYPTCMLKRVEACVCMRCPSVVTVDDHMHLTGEDMMEMGMKCNMIMRMKNHTHSICMILHAHKVRGCVCLMGDIPAVSFTLA